MLLQVVLASLFVSLISLVGGLLILWKNLIKTKIIPYLVSFAAGMLLGTSFFDLLPEAVEEATEVSTVFFATLVGIITFFFLERFLLWFHHHHHSDTPRGVSPSSVLILLGDGIHNFIDGVAIAATFLINPSLGWATTLAISAHEAPHEIADFSVLVNGGMKKMKALSYNFLSALTALGGAVFGYFFLEQASDIVPLAAAFTAGIFIYIACSDLIPDLHKDFVHKKNWAQTVPFIAGLVIAWMITIFLEA